MVQAKTGEILQFSPAKYRRLSVYSLEKSELSVGDQVRITRNDSDLDINNGDRFTVKKITKNDVTLTHQKKSFKLSTRQPLHLDHAYATTVASSQSLSVDQVLIDLETKSLTANRAAITNDISELPGAITRNHIKTAALDVRPLKGQKTFTLNSQKFEGKREERER